MTPARPDEAVSRQAATYPHPSDGWRCFHCGRVFHTYKTAEQHFGRTPESVAACIDDNEGLRRMNAALEMELECHRRMAGQRRATGA